MATTTTQERNSRAAAARLALATLLMAALLGCGDEKPSDDGMAGAPAAPPTLGEPCQTGCAFGLFCSHSGAFDGQCTVACSTDQDCSVVAANARCYAAQCGKSCVDASQCPPGQACSPVAGELACMLP
jgi:hypothetical protein